ncbi:MAG TPA: ABC transporter permease [Bryobacteraceae bacterium]
MLSRFFHRRQWQEERVRELESYLEIETQDNIARGMSPEEARYAARRKLGNLTLLREEIYLMRGVRFLDSLWQDLRYAARMLKKGPAFTAVAVLSLALGIGANTAIFSLVDALLLRPLPVPQPGQLRNVVAQITGSEPYYLSYPMFDALRSRNQVFSRMFAWADLRIQMPSGADVMYVSGVVASGGYFKALGVPPAMGRTFNGATSDPVAVISDRFWSHQFQRSPAAIGNVVTLDHIRFTIIGVMPPGFFGAEVTARPDIWVPLSFTSKILGSDCMSAKARDCWWLQIMGRLKPGISAQQAGANLKLISPRIFRDTLPEDWPAASKRNYLHSQIVATPGAQGRSYLRGQFSNPLAILMGLVGLVLLIACANMANLLLARGSARSREIAVRLAMGAGRGRIIRQLLTESVVLSLLGGAAGTLLAIWFTRLLAAFLESKPAGPSLPVYLNLYPDWRVVLFTFVIAAGSGLVFGLAPALRATRIGIAVCLKKRAHNLRGVKRRIPIERFTLALQAALSVVLVAGAGLFAGSLFHLLTVNPGFNSKDIVLIGIDTTKLQKSSTAVVNLYRRLLERVNAFPGVQAASLMSVTPLSDSAWIGTLSVPGRTDLSPYQRRVSMNLIGSRFFSVMEIPLLSGRPFTATDTPASEKVAIISERTAREYFPNMNPIGRHVVLGDHTAVRIVGVVGDIKYMNLRDPDPRELYLPYSQKAGAIPWSMRLLIKTRSSVASIYPAFHAALHKIAPNVPIRTVETMREQADDSLSRERMMASLSIFFGLLALLLTSVGLYGILAYAVTRRTGEIGIRMALGARGHEVVWIVLRETLGPVAVGIAVGTVAVLALSRLIAGLLYGIRPNDPGNLLLAVFALLFVGAAAAYIPARRASRIDPAVALREE